MKQMLSTLALMGLFALAGLMEHSQVAVAATDVHVRVSSAMPSRVVVTTGTAIRVDNWNNGVQGTIVDPRVAVCIQNHDSADNIFIGFDSTVSTNTTTSVSTSTRVGFVANPGSSDFLCIGAIRGLPIWAMCVDAAGASGCVAAVIQYAKE